MAAGAGDFSNEDSSDSSDFSQEIAEALRARADRIARSHPGITSDEGLQLASGLARVAQAILGGTSQNRSHPKGDGNFPSEEEIIDLGKERLHSEHEDSPVRVEGTPLNNVPKCLPESKACFSRLDGSNSTVANNSETLDICSLYSSEITISEKTTSPHERLINFPNSNRFSLLKSMKRIFPRVPTWCRKPKTDISMISFDIFEEKSEDSINSFVSLTSFTAVSEMASRSRASICCKKYVKKRLQKSIRRRNWGVFNSDFLRMFPKTIWPRLRKPALWSRRRNSRILKKGLWRKFRKNICQRLRKTVFWRKSKRDTSTSEFAYEEIPY